MIATGDSVCDGTPVVIRPSDFGGIEVDGVKSTVGRGVVVIAVITDIGVAVSVCNDVGRGIGDRLVCGKGAMVVVKKDGALVVASFGTRVDDLGVLAGTSFGRRVCVLGTLVEGGVGAWVVVATNVGVLVGTLVVMEGVVVEVGPNVVAKCSLLCDVQENAAKMTNNTNKMVANCIGVILG